ncbi:unnamed protein product [Rhizophagus irregularis]|nr:unnamed protein product [Rhizophagus irregularis]
MYDNNLELVANSTTSNKLNNGKCSLNEIIDHTILYKKGVFKQLSKKGIVFLSQLLSSDGNRMLRYKDLKNRFNISTKGRIPIWFKQLEMIFITNHKLSRKVKDEFNIGRHYQFISPSIENVNVKSRDWIATYTKITDEAVIARIIDNKHDSLIAEHWIQDVNEEISPSVQLPVIKKCNGVEKVEAHSNNQYNDLADKYAKESIDEDSIIFHDQILNFKALFKWNHLIVERDDIQLIKQIFEADNLNQFLNLNRNNLINNRYFFTLVDWKTSYRLNKKSQYITSKRDEIFQQLAIKIKANELPTLDNLHKRSPRLYPSNLQCQFCKNCNETLNHLWTYSQLTEVYKELFDSLYDILSVWIKKFCTFDNVDDILDQEKSIFIQSLQMSNDFNISHLAKGLISMEIVDFLREKFKLDQNSRDIIFEQFYRIVIFKFSFYIWIKRNSLVLDLERHIGITNKMKKKRNYTGNHNLVTVFNSINNNLFKDTDRFKYWLKYAYAYGGYFLDF